MDERARRRIAMWPMSRDPLTRSFELLDMQATVDFLAREKAAGKRITLTTVAVRAASLALRAVPRVNSRIFLGRMEARTDNSIAYVVNTPEGVLQLGHVSDAYRESLLDNAAALTRGAQDARNVKLVPLLPAFIPSPITRRAASIMRGWASYRGTQASAPVGVTMVPPDGRTDHRVIASAPFVPHTHETVAIALGPLHDAVIARDGHPVVTKGMWVGHTFDHRVVDGSERIPFQTAFADAMQQAERFAEPTEG